jgi:two-component system chemotaxis response regulator CheB
LPSDFPLPILVAQHVASGQDTNLAHVLAWRSTLDVEVAGHAQRVEPSRVYVAPSDCHMAIGPTGRLLLSRTPKVEYSRPSGTVLFQSVAAHCGSRALGVVLSGSNRDGSMGVQAIKRRGGTVLAQDPLTTDFPRMPAAAVQTGCVDFVLPLEKILPALVTLTMVRGAAALFRRGAA